MVSLPLWQKVLAYPQVQAPTNQIASCLKKAVYHFAEVGLYLVQEVCFFWHKAVKSIILFAIHSIKIYVCSGVWLVLVNAAAGFSDMLVRIILLYYDHKW